MKISIRVVLIIMMVLLAVISCTIIGVLIAQAGVESANQGADLLRKETVARKQLEIGNHFRKPIATLESLKAAAKVPGTFNHADPFTYNNWMCAATVVNGYVNVYLGTENGLLIYPTVEAPGSPCVLWIVDAITATSGGMTYNFTADGVPFLVDPFTSNGPESFDPRLRPWYNVSRYKTSWSEVYINWNSLFTALTPGAPMYDIGQARLTGVFATDFNTVDLIEYLGKIVIAKTGTMILVESKTRNVIGATWNETVVFNNSRTDCGTSKNESCYVQTMATLRDLNETMLKGAVSSLTEDYLYGCTRNDTSAEVLCKTSYGKGRDRVFVDVVGVQDSVGLDLRLIIMIPERDFLGEVWERSDLAAVIATVVVFALICMSVVVVYLVLKPLQRVEERLYCAATLEDQDDDDDESIFSEVANIQTAYNKMVVELKRIRSYVPQSLLRTLDNLDDDDTESEGTVEQSNGGGVGSAHMSAGSRRTADNKSYKSKRSDTMSVASKAALVGGRTLNTAVSLNARRATILVVNLAGFHKTVRALDTASLLRSHSESMKTINQIVSAQKGVFDVFSGDHFTITFNAVTNCASHVTRAAACILQIGAKIEIANFGAASGQLLCGNMGIDEIKRFSMVGPTVNHAHVLERLCKVVGAKSLVTYTCYETMQFEYHMECVDVVQLPFTKSPTPVATVVGSKGGMSDEWMYVLKENEDASTFTDLNEAYLKYVGGDVEAAKALLGNGGGGDSQHIGAKALKQMLGVPAEEWGKRLGLYYDVALNAKVQAEQ